VSYDIPDEVKYREKIVFGLDLRQLLYSCLFGILAYLSYSLPLEGQAKLVLPSTLCIIGVGFAFLNLEEKALDLAHYYLGVQKAGNFEPQAQKLVGIRSIENNQITLMDGSLRAILQVEPINFSLLDEGQKAAFVSNYREFLNHLPTPVQILVRTEKSDAEEVFKRMQENMEGASREVTALFRDFFDFESEFLDKQSLRKRKYYLIVAQPAGSQGQSQLEQRAKIMQEKLASCGLRSEMLGTERLLRFFSTYSIHGYWEESNGG